MEINIKGTIVPNDDAEFYEWYGVDCTAPKHIHSAFEKANGEDVDIYINSGGGDIFSATEIYSAIRDYEGKSKIHITGLAASAASVIMCASECDISPTSMVMIHNVSTVAGGNYRDFSHESEVLRKADKAMCQAYVQKSGKSEEEFLKLMDKETWLTAKEAVELGLCDNISGKESLINGYCTILSDEQRRKYKTEKAKAQLSLEKLKMR